MSLDVQLFGKDFARRGWLNNAQRVEVTWRWNRRGLATFAIPADHERATALTEPGARVLVTYVPDGAGAVAQQWSGAVTTVQAQGPRAASVLTITATGDWIDRILAWPVPGAALTGQNVENYTATGPAETVVRNAIAANVTRLGLPWTVAASGGRGATVSVSARWIPLSEVLEAAADLGGIGVRCLQSGVGISVTFAVGADRTVRVLSEAGGTVTSWSLTANVPKATRAVVGLDGEGVARTYATATDAAAEAAWGVTEVFIDARDLGDGVSGATRGTDKLAELAATTSVTATLAETDTVRFGRNLFLGDLVAVETLPGLVSTERVREARLTYTADEGLTVEPVIGDPDATEPERAMASQISRIAAAVRLLRAR